MKAGGTVLATPGFMGTEHIRTDRVEIDGRSSRVFVGGRGVPLLLVHGAWGSAAAHWEPVWDLLAPHFHVVAPDLPGIGDTTLPPLPTVKAYARWLVRTLDALDLGAVWVVGNSFGVSVACRFALDFPDRCRGLVCVNGFPMPRTPQPLRWLGHQAFGRRLLRAVETRAVFRQHALDRGFVDPKKIPDELRELVQEKTPAPAAAMADLLIAGDERLAALPPSPLLLWGAGDRLFRTSARDAERLRARWPGATLELVPDAGHLPQVENPYAFADGLTRFIDARESQSPRDRSRSAAPLCWGSNRSASRRRSRASLRRPRR
jgi:pimeloyl-ACP methyl ester carboxylesterase